ncbi:MAG: aromatic amino acid transport family protein [Bacillota bacterium]|nr:aromatic amino acid transport family protein [Bacillota bacterium]
MNIKDKSELTFFEAASIIVGHGVGAGILSVPYLAAHNSFREMILILLLAYVVALVLHFIIAELSYNNGGAQFVSCFDAELFSGKLKKILTWTAFVLLGVSVIFNVSAFLTGAAAVFRNWFGLPDIAGMLIFYVVGAGVVFVGMKLVGICEKIAVASMLGVVGILFAATLLRDTAALPTGWRGFNNALALFGMISFSLSAVMSTPQVVKGLKHDAKRIRAAIAVGLAINACLIFIITLMTLLCAGQDVTGDGALVDLSRHIGGWVSIVGYVFTLLALATSFWANTLNLRDIVHEQTKWNTRLSWLAASLPCLALALFGLSSFVGFTRFASVIQVVTGIGIIVAYNLSRKRVGCSPICGKLGSLPFQLLVIGFSLLSSVGALLSVN